LGSREHELDELAVVDAVERWRQAVDEHLDALHSMVDNVVEVQKQFPAGVGAELRALPGKLEALESTVDSLDCSYSELEEKIEKMQDQLRLLTARLSPDEIAAAEAQVRLIKAIRARKEPWE
jgi:uncharacterized coiled-coil protein SlyX